MVTTFKCMWCITGKKTVARGIKQKHWTKEVLCALYLYACIVSVLIFESLLFETGPERMVSSFIISRTNQLVAGGMTYCGLESNLALKLLYFA